jgi:hypothetical protein
MLVEDNKNGYFVRHYSVIAWNRMLTCKVGLFNYSDDGSISGWVEHGISELTITGSDAKELAHNATVAINWSLRN